MAYRVQESNCCAFGHGKEALTASVFVVGGGDSWKEWYANIGSSTQNLSGADAETRDRNVSSVNQ